MPKLSTRQAAKKLGVGMTTLTRYIAGQKVPAPKPTLIGRYEVRAWTESDIERVRKLLPKIANGRKTRYQKQKGKTQTKKQTKPKRK